MFYLGLKSIWLTHIFWGWLIICFYMAFQAKYIRRSGVMTFAEWNVTRFGNSRDTEHARLAAATFLLILMVFNLMFMAVGTGKFAEEFLPFSRWQSALIVFGVVGIYVTLGGFKGVIVTDVFQTMLIAVGAIVLGAMAMQTDVSATMLATKDPSWSSLTPTWTLWPSYLADTPPSYAHYNAFGTMLLAGFSWLIFRVLAGPNVWDFQFFLTTKSPRSASLAAGTWTVGYTLRWIIACSFLILGMAYLGTDAGFDAEKIMPLVLKRFPIGPQGIFMAILLAALMSTLAHDQCHQLLSSLTTSWVHHHQSQTQTARLCRPARLRRAITLGFVFSLALPILCPPETMILSAVTMILVPPHAGGTGGGSAQRHLSGA
jgi:Na+/proline symporter